MTRPGVAVLIPTYNRARFLPECLESILNQTLPAAEVMVINDGSSDDTLPILAPYRDKIQYIETNNAGKSAALNTALQRVTSEYVWIFDDDDVALPDALERFVQALDQHPDCGFAYSPYYISRANVEDGRLEPESVFPSSDISEEDFIVRLLEANFLCGAAVLARTSCYREVGPFRVDLFRSQDYEMAIRLSRKYRWIKVEGPTFHYRQHGGARGASFDRFAAERQYEKWREYDSKFFRDLRAEIGLRAYLPRDVVKTDLSPADMRRAYLQRMFIMASKWLFEEMADDLSLALATGTNTPPLSGKERNLIWRATELLPSGDNMPITTALLRKVKALCAGGDLGREIQFEFLRAIFWRASAFWRGRAFRQAFQFLLAFVRLADFRGIANLVSHKLGLRPGLNIASPRDDQR